MVTQGWAVGLLTWACAELSLPHRFYTAFSLLSRYIRHQTWLSTCIVVPKSDTIYEAMVRMKGKVTVKVGCVLTRCFLIEDHFPN